jgi:hypothetical protein
MIIPMILMMTLCASSRHNIRIQPGELHPSVDPLHQDPGLLTKDSINHADDDFNQLSAGMYIARSLRTPEIWALVLGSDTFLDNSTITSMPGS